MKHADKLAKYVVAIDHKSGYEKGFTYYPLKSKEMAIAFAEAKGNEGKRSLLLDCAETRGQGHQGVTECIRW